MRELTAWVRFTCPSLGNVKERHGSGRFWLPRNPAGQVIFLPTWHQSNMRLASRLLGRHQDEVSRILWDLVVEQEPPASTGWIRRYYPAGTAATAAGTSGRSRYALHEAFLSGQVVGFRCVVPETISDDDFWQLMALAGRYKGLSPWQPGKFGFFEVARLQPLRGCGSVTAADASAAAQEPMMKVSSAD